MIVCLFLIIVQVTQACYETPSKLAQHRQVQIQIVDSSPHVKAWLEIC